MEQEIASKPVLLGQIEFQNNQFAPAINQIWYFCILGISKNALNPPLQEVIKAAWISITEIEASTTIFAGYKLSEEILSAIGSVKNKLGFHEILNKGWKILRAPISSLAQ